MAILSFDFFRFRPLNIPSAIRISRGRDAGALGCCPAGDRQSRAAGALRVHSGRRGLRHSGGRCRSSDLINAGHGDHEHHQMQLIPRWALRSLSGYPPDDGFCSPTIEAAGEVLRQHAAKGYCCFLGASASQRSLPKAAVTVSKPHNLRTDRLSWRQQRPRGGRPCRSSSSSSSSGG